MLLTSRVRGTVRIRVRIRFSVWVVSGYACVFLSLTNSYARGGVSLFRCVLQNRFKKADNIITKTAEFFFGLLMSSKSECWNDSWGHSKPGFDCSHTCVGTLTVDVTIGTTSLRHGAMARLSTSPSVAIFFWRQFAFL